MKSAFALNLRGEILEHPKGGTRSSVEGHYAFGIFGFG